VAVVCGDVGKNNRDGGGDPLKVLKLDERRYGHSHSCTGKNVRKKADSNR
jgi:hypothetical protein